VDVRNRVNPSQFSRPRIPAAAPAKHAERNFTVVKEELATTLGPYMSCAVVSSVVDMADKFDGVRGRRCL